MTTEREIWILKKVTIGGFIAIFSILFLQAIAVVVFIFSGKNPIQNVEENQLLTSNLEQQRYECTGHCFCEEDERRNSISASSRSLMFLVAAVSSLGAIKIAKNSFNEFCEKSFLDECEESRISSEVNQCSVVFGDDAASHDAHSDVDVALYDMVSRSFDCFGECVGMLFNDGSKTKIEENKFFENIEKLNDEIPFDVSASLQKTADEHDCKALSLKKRIDIEYQENTLSHLKYPIVRKSYFLTAERHFMKFYLNQHCSENSLKRVRKSIEQSVFSSKMLPMCAGHRSLSNPSVKCVEVEGQQKFY